MENLDAKIALVADGEVTIEMSFSEKLSQQHRYVHLALHMKFRAIAY